ncbi:uncharacterized protein LOC135820290 [Sycon ciliatum]|uniref:uncharacterized protein LOC135820290 n=1 Tax=Sycon ciliatum TaxID=27933 RepID=UPI0031F616EA
MINVAQITASAIGLEFGVSKCATLHVHRGVLESSDAEPVDTLLGMALPTLQEDNMYKYLKFLESAALPHGEIKSKLREDYGKRLDAIFKSGLTAGYLAKAVNTYAMPLLTYSFGIINWRPVELEQLDILLRKKLTKKGWHHPRAYRERVHLVRAEGGGGFQSVVDLHERSLIQINKYIEGHQDHIAIALLKQYHHEKAKYSVSSDAAKYLAKIGMEESATKEQIRQGYQRHREETIRKKPLHGQFWLMLQDAELDRGLSFAWLRSSALRPATESIVMAIQDQAIPTRNLQEIFNRGTGVSTKTSCRMCGRDKETVFHLIGACTACAGSHYINRHNRLAKYLHWTLCRKYGASDISNKYTSHQLTNVVYSAETDVSIYWEVPIPTAAPVGANRPDIIIKGKDEAFLVDVSVPLDRNIRRKSVEKIQKYQGLKREMEQMWQVRAKIVPVIVGALGGLTPSTADFVRELDAGASVSILQKEALLGTVDIIRSITQMK